MNRRRVAEIVVVLAGFALVMGLVSPAGALPADQPATTATIEDTSSLLAWTGSWIGRDHPEASGGTERTTTRGGSRAFASFEGTGVAWVSSVGPSGGRADVLIDGAVVATVDLYAETTSCAQTVWGSGALDSGRHSVVIRACEGTGAVAVDALAIAGAPRQAYAPTPFRYPWRSYIVIDKSQFRLYLVKDGLLIKTYPVAHGKVHWSTPARVWRVGAKYKPDPKGIYGPRKLRLFKRVGSVGHYRYVFSRYGIHGTNQPWVIGTRASHGCIRMYNRDVLDLFPRVPVGTMVVTKE